MDSRSSLIALSVAAFAVFAPAQSLASVSIKPHKAIYKMELFSAKNGSSIKDVSGQLFFEWADSCDGWAVQQHLRMRFSYAQGSESELNSTVVSWESKDGKNYNFNVRRLTDGKETENYRGKAAVNEKGGKGEYSVPSDKEDADLPAGTVFPSTHTITILDHAEKGTKFFSRRVFDGSDEIGQADISSFIGKKTETKDDKDVSKNLKDNSLLASPAWPIRMAFFKPDAETGEPDYEMDLTLQNNGISRFMKIDYGDFTVSGTLLSVEALPEPGC